MLNGADRLGRRPFVFFVFASTAGLLLCFWTLILPSSRRIISPARISPAVCKHLPSAIPCDRGQEKPVIQPSDDQHPIIIPSNARAKAVKDAFASAFNLYWVSCRGRDEIMPRTGKCRDTRNQWGASAVDALSTAIIMKQEEIVEQILEFIPAIDFNHTEQQVSLFETTIRYLGGLLAGYDLLTGPFQHITNNKTSTEALLTQSKTLADALRFAFDTPTGIPHNDLWINQTWVDMDTNGLATTGTLVLEWARLSDLLGDPYYGELAFVSVSKFLQISVDSLSRRFKGESYLIDAKPSYNVPFPGLPGTRINIDDGLFVDARGGWNGGDDSYYEYLIKMYVYDPVRFASYRDAWIQAADSSIKYLATHPSTKPDITFLAGYDNHTLTPVGTHLGCFAGGNFLLGGQVLDRPDYVEFGLQLTSGCHETYIGTATGIGPEVFSWNITELEESQKSYYDEHGFWISNAGYQLRPEVIESYYYAYRITGDKKYQDWAWDAFVAINRTCRAEYGFASIDDVNDPHGGKKLDFQESFMFAEVLKYSYLIQADDGPFQVNYKGRNEFVYNTEAHPLRVARRSQ